MSLRQSFSRFRKKAKDKLSNIGKKARSRGANVGDEEIDHSSLSLQSEPVVATRDLGDTRLGIEKDDPQPVDPRSVSQSMVEREREPGGSNNYPDRPKSLPPLSSQSKPCVAAEDELRGGHIETGGEKDGPYLQLDDSPLVSRQAMGIGHDQRGSNDKASREETDQEDIHPPQNAQTESGSNPERRGVDGERANQVDPPLRSESDIEKRKPTPPTSRDSGSNSM